VRRGRPRGCAFDWLKIGGQSKKLPISTFGLGSGEGRLLGEVFLGILRGFGRGFSFPEGWRSRGLGGHEFYFSFSFGGRDCFSFRVGGFKSLNIYFLLLEV